MLAPSPSGPALRAALAAILAPLLTFACVSSDPGALLNRKIQEPYADSRLVPVYFASNRKVSASRTDCLNASFGVESDRELRFGSCEVNVPKQHAVGAVDVSESRLADPNVYFKMGRHASLSRNEFFARIAAAEGEEALLFVHGFNVRFEEANLRAAQIVYDAKFQGPAVLFTWPAGARDGILSDVLINRTYAENQRNAAETIPLFAEFLRGLAATGKRIHVKVHSMGHQIVLPALAQLRNEGAGRLLDELILNAPDFPTEELRRIAPDLIPTAKRITLYCSPGDNALQASRRLNGNHRAGLCAKVEGIDVINVNPIDAPALGVGGLGHGYYSGRPLLTDVYQTLLGIEVEKRLFIRRSDPGGGEDWILRR